MTDLMAVPGFLFSGVSCGIKADGALDLGVVYAPNGATLAGVYTQNQVVAAPVVLSRQASQNHTVQALVVNSGNANACTGSTGAADAAEMVKHVSDILNVPVADVQICSTGVIGQTLPMPKIIRGIESACQLLDESQIEAFAESIRTTDLYRKIASGTLEVGENRYRILGIAKGAGMIAPNMATMLAFVFTDAPMEGKTLQKVWQRVCDKTFNAMTVDGDTSTNDTALILSSGQDESPLSETDLEEFERVLLDVCDELAHLIVGDGEGATKAVRITVRGARSMTDARQVADVIARSPLVKTALHGEDPNWGRFIAAAGRSGVRLDPDNITLSFNAETLYANGRWCGEEAEAAVCAVMKHSRYEIVLDLKLGSEYASVLTCDLTAEYIRINADYRS